MSNKDTLILHEDDFENLMGKKRKTPHHNFTVDGPKKEKSTKKYSVKNLLRINPKTPTQEKVFDSWYEDHDENEEDKHLFLHGSAGTGKSFLAIYFALEAILSKQTHYKKLIIVRSAVPSREIGFLPGDIQEKTQAYEDPYRDIFSELLNDFNAYDDLKDAGIVQFTTTSYLRGKTFNDSIILVDEIQNMQFGELDTVITRIGKNGRIIFAGDSRQNDLINKRGETSGYMTFFEIIQSMKKYFVMHEFEPHDIVRSGLVKDYIIRKEQMFAISNLPQDE